MSAIVPILAALITGGAAIHSSVQQRRTASKQRALQREALGRQEASQRRQEGIAREEKERLQREQSDELSRRRTKGRRSLLAGEETGVTLGGRRSTTG